MTEIANDDYGLSKVAGDSEMEAPDLLYRPRDPQRYRPAIGLIGCGGISAHHLAAYQQAGYHVVALCDLDEGRARERQTSYYPQADVYTNYHDLLRRDDIEVVDVATHPAERLPILQSALEARKHVLSQKPFVLDLDAGERLRELADRQGVRLAINQNGRWAPHWSYLRAAVGQGLLGALTSADFAVHWDHSWTADTPFNDIHDLILYDFAIHWFDIVTAFFGSQQPQRVRASVSRATAQRGRPPMLAHVLIDYPQAQATMHFDATVVHGQQDRTFLAGTQGSAVSVGPSLSEQAITLHTASGYCHPPLQGTWFRDGFHGTMAELLCAIEEGRDPITSPQENLRSLALAFAAIASAHDGVAKVPGEVRHLPQA
ncbi:MAG: Gfo/Idh/MocA family oxidoreductase [Herpetosiphonaceae bacterium]|nr:Gfo/Idh/MocA family oxidoreductase [Herpetosiphonaceae bacterium]